MIPASDAPPVDGLRLTRSNLHEAITSRASWTPERATDDGGRPRSGRTRGRCLDNSRDETPAPLFGLRDITIRAKEITQVGDPLAGSRAIESGRPRGVRRPPCHTVHGHGPQGTPSPQSGSRAAARQSRGAMTRTRFSGTVFGRINRSRLPSPRAEDQE
jgi:hypothetical protein